MNLVTTQRAAISAAAILTTLMTGCGGGGGGGGGQPIGNLRSASVRLVSQAPNAAHEMTLATTIEASQNYNDVAVAYVLLNKADVDAKKTDVRQHEVSASVFATITAGTAEYQTFVSIPESVREDSEWYLISQIDPADAITETDESDNLPTDGSKVFVKIGNANTDRADVVMESADIENDAVILWQQTNWLPVNTTANVDDHDFSATLVLTTTGSQELSNVDLQASIAIPGSSQQFPLQIWDEASNSFAQKVFADAKPGDPDTVHLDLMLPDNGAGGARQTIERHLRQGGSNKFTVTFFSNLDGVYPEWENGVNRFAGRQGPDNQADATVVIVLPPTVMSQCNNILWDRGLKKTWRNKVFALGVDFSSSSSLDQRGAIAQARAAVPVKLFGATSNALDLRAFGRVTPQENAPTDSEFTLDFDVFGVSVFSTSSNDPSYTYDKTVTYTKSRTVTGRVFAGPIPIQLKATATGSMGYRVRAYIDPAQLEVLGQAFANLKARATASVNAVVAEVGVGGTMSIIDDVFTARGECFLGIPSNGKLTGTLTMEVTNELTGPKGRIYIYEKHKEPKWCHKVIPCGLRTVRNEKTIARFRTFYKKDVLFHLTKTETVCLN